MLTAQRNNSATTLMVLPHGGMRNQILGHEVPLCPEVSIHVPPEFQHRLDVGIVLKDSECLRKAEINTPRNSKGKIMLNWHEVVKEVANLKFVHEILLKEEDPQPSLAGPLYLCTHGDDLAIKPVDRTKVNTFIKEIVSHR
jgi:hypothetical protein